MPETRSVQQSASRRCVGRVFENVQVVLQLLLKNDGLRELAQRRWNEFPVFPSQVLSVLEESHALTQKHYALKQPLSKMPQTTRQA